MATNWTLTIDCAHPAALAAFWSAALGYVAASPPEGFGSWQEWLTHLGVPEEECDDGGGRGEPWEVRWPRVTETVERLITAGATVIREDRLNGTPDHVVMADPDGNEFCVL